MNKWTLLAAAVAVIIGLFIWLFRSAADDLENDY